MDYGIIVVESVGWDGKGNDIFVWVMYQSEERREREWEWMWGAEDDFDFGLTKEES